MMTYEWTPLVEPSGKLAKWLLQWWKGRVGRLTAAEILQLRLNWKPIFENRMREQRIQRLCGDILLRNVDQLSGYSEARPTKSSAVIRGVLVGTYSDGIQILLDCVDLTRCVTGGWRHSAANEHGELAAVLIGYVPYEQLVAVDWEGDENSGDPILYCYFDTKLHKPYARSAYCVAKSSPHPEGDKEVFYPVSDYDEVLHLSRNVGTRL